MNFPSKKKRKKEEKITANTWAGAASPALGSRWWEGFGLEWVEFSLQKVLASKQLARKMADLVLSSVLDVIVDKLANPLLKSIGDRYNLNANIQKLKCSLLMVRPILEDAEEKQATSTAVRIWLLKFKDAAYNAEELLLDSSPFFSLTHATRVKEMLQTLEMAADEGLRLNLRERNTVHNEWDRRETSSFVVETEVYGREEDKAEIVKMLLSCEMTEGGEALCIPIVGLGGIGKTTLAQLAYNDHKVTHHFDVKVWVYVSAHFRVENIMTKVMESLTKDKCHPYSNMDAQQSAISSLLRNKRYLIVLDDVWTENQDDWDKLRLLFRSGIDGSKILITTRSKRVALVTNSPTFPYYVKELSEDACWSLFRQRAFQRREEEQQHPTLLPIGQQIVRKCGGVALAAKTLGSLMRFKRDLREWLYIRDSELWNFDECEGGILPALRLSCSHLPLHLKRCFSFCSVFPRGYEFKKDKLIHLWMAEGFIDQSINDSRRKEPEGVGNDYFNDLQQMSFFQEVRQGENGVVVGYKMHDVIYDLARSITGPEYAILDHGFATPTSFSQIRHSSVCNLKSSPIPEELYEASHLRTLLLFSQGSLEQVPPKLYSSFKYLTVLDLCGSGLIILDGLIGSLKNLKFLDLSHTHIRRLPPEISSLRSLQTLNLVNCYNLVALPDLSQMTSLRHLNNDGCKQLTGMMEIRNFTKYDQLQTLPLYVIGGSEDILFLNKLQLRDSLKITHLENVEKGIAGTGAISLKHMEGLESFGLYWGSDDCCPNPNPEEGSVLSRFQERKQTPPSEQSDWIPVVDPYIEEEILRELEPHCYLRRLLIKGYIGYKFPHWNVPHLKAVSLIDCRGSIHLPILGNLQSLTSLSLRGMHGVRCIGKEFYGDGKEKPFPALEELVLIDFPNLTEWLSPDMGGNVFPKLIKLVINKCPKLDVMPHILSVQHLDLRDCSVALLHSFQNLRSLETLVIEEISRLSYFSGAFPIGNPLLTKLEIRSCRKLAFLPRDLENLAALKSLVIRWCQGLNTLPRSMQYLHALESLEIGDCHSLKSLPDGGNRGLSNLRSLSIENCENLISLSMAFQYLTSLEILTIMYCPSITELPSSLEHLSSLRSLSILCCPQLMYLPDELQNLTTLHSLEIRSCPGLEVLPEWIEKLVSLRSLAISDCHNITFLPDGIKGLIALQHLSIHDCPQLLQRCREERGEDWPKIAHIPYKHIESPNLKRQREDGSSSSNY